ncbi:MAG: protein kinase, partial [Myxococcota bacterium]
MTRVLADGETVERYTVASLLGEGGMAEVYLVHHVTLQTRHALKVLTLTGPTLHDRLVAEGRVQAQLRHSNVVAVTDVLDVKGMPALVMEYVDGPDLARWIRSHRPDAATAEALFRGVVAGVAAAHDAGHVHRDLKTANVLVATGPTGELVPK